ncbi:MAG: hydantoinase B/oxoprolinase family protein, partial [candidate division NC10 bacterium]
MTEIVAKYGADVVSKCTAMLLAYSERRIREALRRFPDGSFTGEDWIDDDGVTDEPIKIRVNIEKRGDRAKVDFEGTARQVRGNINCPVATTYAAVYYAIIAITDPHCPPNSGCYRPVEIHARPGLIVNPEMPAAVAARTNTSQKIVESMMKAFAGVVPVFFASWGTLAS